MHCDWFHAQTDIKVDYLSDIDLSDECYMLFEKSHSLKISSLLSVTSGRDV